MTRTPENRTDIAATVDTPASEAGALRARAEEIRRELAELHERMEHISDALRRQPTG